MARCMNIIVKILGCIDLAAALALLLLVFGMHVMPQYLLFCAGLLFLKSLFILSGDILSAIDLVSSIILILSLFFMLPVALLWIPAFFLLSKGFVIFLKNFTQSK